MKTVVIFSYNDNLIDKIYLYAKDLSEPKYKFLIRKYEDADAGIKNFDDPSAFIEHSNIIDDIYSNTDNYNPRRQRIILIVFDHMIADIMTNKNFQAIIEELFIRCRKLNLLYLSHSLILEFQKMSD